MALTKRTWLGHVLWTASVVLTLVPALSWVLADLRRKHFGTVLQSEVVAVGSTVIYSEVVDESALTGETDPVTRLRGDHARSVVVNAGTAVDVVASANADESIYAHGVRLARAGVGRVSAGRAARGPDRRVWFLPFALAIAVLVTAGHRITVSAAVGRDDRGHRQYVPVRRRSRARRRNGSAGPARS